MLECFLSQHGCLFTSQHFARNIRNLDLMPSESMHCCLHFIFQSSQLNIDVAIFWLEGLHKAGPPFWKGVWGSNWHIGSIMWHHCHESFKCLVVIGKFGTSTIFCYSAGHSVHGNQQGGEAGEGLETKQKFK